jgi:hypothetical protein
MSTSTAKALANRRNATLSTGPRTLAGKLASSRNAQRHGILAAAVVLPHAERAEDWQAHHGAVLADLAPVGAIEEALADRVAVLLWRLGRVTRYETAELAEAQHKAEPDAVRSMRDEAGLSERWRLPANLEEAREVVADADAVVRLLGELEHLDDDAEVPQPAAVSLAFVLERAAMKAAEDAGRTLDSEEIDVDGFPDDICLDDASVRWTAGLVRATVRAYAADAGMSGDELERDAMRQARRKRTEAAEHLATLEADIRRRRGRGLMLPSDLSDKVARYESHVERSLFRAMHELQRLQADRGARGSAPAALDVDVNMGPRRLDA